LLAILSPPWPPKPTVIGIVPAPNIKFVSRWPPAPPPPPPTPPAAAPEPPPPIIRHSTSLFVDDISFTVNVPLDVNVCTRYCSLFTVIIVSVPPVAKSSLPEKLSVSVLQITIPSAISE